MFPATRRASIVAVRSRLRLIPRGVSIAGPVRRASSLADRQWASDLQPDRNGCRSPTAPSATDGSCTENHAKIPTVTYTQQIGAVEQAIASGGPNHAGVYNGERRGGAMEDPRVFHNSSWNQNWQSGATSNPSVDYRYGADQHSQGFYQSRLAGSNFQQQPQREYWVQNGSMRNSIHPQSQGYNQPLGNSWSQMDHQRMDQISRDDSRGFRLSSSGQFDGSQGGYVENGSVGNGLYRQALPASSTGYQQAVDTPPVSQPKGWQQGSHWHSGNGYQCETGGAQQWRQASTHQENSNCVASQRVMEFRDDAGLHYSGRSSGQKNSSPSWSEPYGSYVANGLEGRNVATDSEANITSVVTFDELDNVCKEGDVEKMVELLDLLEKQGTVVDLPRYLQLMKLCGDPRCLEDARIVHGHLSRSYKHVGVEVYNEMLVMYSKCGAMDDARVLFDAMPEKNIASWGSMILGLANNGMGEEAVDLFSEFKQRRLVPDRDIFNTVFHACGVMGAVDEGMLHFESISKEFGMEPDMGHYNSVVGMLGASGHLDEALEFIESMPFDASVDVWETLMNLCRVNGNVEIGNRCAEIVENMDSSRLTKESRAGLVPVKAAHQVKKEKKKLELLAARTKVHEYRCGDKSHPEKDRIYGLLWSLAPIMKEAGYVPEVRFVLHDVDQESREDALLYHSERLATAHGLLTSPARTPIRVIKNLRICGDCHNAMKILSKVVGRQLIMRDAKRFHHFENGVCSCKDYW